MWPCPKFNGTSGGRLHLVPDVGKIPLADAVLIEDPTDHGVNDDDDCSMSSHSSSHSETSNTSCSFQNRDFKIILDIKTGSQPQVSVHLVAHTLQEKAAWVSDISQCMDNVHFNDLLHSSMSDTSSVTMPQSIKNDPKLFKDDVDIRFSRTLNSCKVPQIRYATPERLLQRLTDLRFLSIDFLNTFLLTYRVFTDSVTVLEALKKVFYNADPPEAQTYPAGSFMDELTSTLQLYDPERRRSSVSPRRTSGASSVSGYGSDMSDCRDRSHSYDSQAMYPRGVRRCSFRNIEEEQSMLPVMVVPGRLSPTVQSPRRKVSIRVEDVDTNMLTIPNTIAGSSSSDTLTDQTVVSAPTSPSNLSTATLVASSGSDSSGQDCTKIHSERFTSPPAELCSPPPPPPHTPGPISPPSKSTSPKTSPSRTSPCKVTSPLKTSPGHESSSPKECESGRQGRKRFSIESTHRKGSNVGLSEDRTDWPDDGEMHPPLYSASSSRSASIVMQNYYSGYSARRSLVCDGEGGGSVSQRTSFQHDSPQNSSKAGVVITSFRQSQRRSSTSTAAAAFAIATSASSNPPDLSPVAKSREAAQRLGSCKERNRRKESVMSTAATMRVLNVLRHWVSKHSQDFEQDQRLKNLTIEYLDDIIYSPNLLPAEHKAASQLLRLITKEDPESSKVDLDQLLSPPISPSKESIETLSALEIAEQMTYLDHQIFVAIRSEEFLGQAWMKTDKATRAPHIILMTRRFNEVSQLVVSEIVRRSSINARINAIEKWAAVADISRCLHNFNGVLQVCAAFTNSSVYRLKKTWEKVSKTTKQTIEKLQNIVSSDGRFRNLRDALHRCDPPSIPYLGMYLTDLSFIEEGTPNFTDDGLLNFSKMRMIAHVIREIRHYQQTPYKIDLITKVTNYLLDPSLLLDDDDLYQMSLEIEPRTSRLSVANIATTLPSPRP